MCIGIPMQIVEQHGETAVCQYQGQTVQIDMMLVGEQAVGSWILVFLETAREVLTEQQAQDISYALQALQLAMQGETNLDYLFADLVNRQPTLPEFLRT